MSWHLFQHPKSSPSTAAHAPEPINKFSQIQARILGPRDFDQSTLSLSAPHNQQPAAKVLRPVRELLFSLRLEKFQLIGFAILTLLRWQSHGTGSVREWMGMKRKETSRPLGLLIIA